MQPLIDWISAHTKARSVVIGDRIQSLWSGYGELRRVHLTGAPWATLVVKSVEPPARAEHPRGWSGDRGHARKLRSYAVEHAFYAGPAHRTDDACRVARPIALEASGGRWRFLLEDLDAAGFSARRDDPSEAELEACLAWLAAFHARFLGEAPEGLWPTGTYWHLATRPDELEAMEDGPLKAYAARLDARLAGCAYPTLVHGDAKVENFCFRPGGGEVAAVDFQYVGGGAGIRDVAYLFTSARTEAECAASAERWLDRYFHHLRQFILRRGDASAADLDRLADAVEAAWRALYPIACADFDRFLAGWAPRHWKRNRYTDDQVERALAELERG